MDRALDRIYQYWSSPVGGAFLYGAFATHYSLALWALWLRRSLRMPVAEATQLVLGFSIPFFLVDHVLQTRVADTFYGAHYGHYSTLLHAYFVANPVRGGLQLTVLVIAWVHAMIGLWFWLRLKPWYPRWQPILFAFALLMPTFAILGFFEGGREVMAMASDPDWIARVTQAHPRPASADAASLDRLVVWMRYAFLAALLAVLAARVVRWYWERRQGVVKLTYPSGRVVEMVRGVSVLEASRMGDIPHASVCGGRGRCSTCRIRVEGAPDSIPPPASEEIRVLHRVGAAPDVRLACQLRPRGDLRVTPLHLSPPRPRTDFVVRGISTAPSARSLFCSAISGRLPNSPKTSSPMIWFFCSTDTSPRWAMRWKQLAAASTNSSAMGSWRCSGSTAASRPAVARRSPRPGTWPSGCKVSIAHSSTKSPSRCASASASIPALRSSAKWGTAPPFQ
jgi:adenylate cyclase